MNFKARKINKRKLIGVLILIIVVIIIFSVYLVYTKNETFRRFFDKNCLNKYICENQLTNISIENYKNSHFFAYSKYIVILENNILSIYNDVGNLEKENNIFISNPIVDINKEYLLIAEKNNSKIYLIKDKEIKWEKNMEGKISRILVNSNGYVAVVLSGTAYKSVIIMFDNHGNQIFKTYLSNSFAVDISISEDNEYLAIAEIDTTGILIQSYIKVVSIDKAKNDPKNAFIYVYKEENNSLIVNIKYQNKNDLICQYDNSIKMIKENKNILLTKLDNKNEKVTFSSINLDKGIIKNIEDTKSNTKTTLKIINLFNKKENSYSYIGVLKELYCIGDKIALNLGTEVHFINSKGRLIKKYNSKRFIRKIIISEKIAGIIYRDRIEIIKL